MNCDCITRVNEKLAEQNMELDTSIVGIMSPQPYATLDVSTHWKDSTKKVRGKKPTTNQPVTRHRRVEGREK